MPKYYNLPEYDERRRLQKELRENVDKTIPGYEAYAKAMEELDKKMDAYSELDQWGVAKQIDAAGKKELQDAIAVAAMAGEALLKNAKDAQGEKVNDTIETVRKVQGMMSRDMNLLQQYDPEASQKKSLPELQEDARTATVDIGSKDFEKMSGAQSERIPMTIQDAKGKKIKGFFTKANTFSVKPAFNRLLERVKRTADEPEFFNDFLKKYREARLKKEPNVAKYSDEFLIADLIRKSSGGQPNALKLHLGKVFDMTSYELSDKFGNSGLNAFTEELQKIADVPAVTLNLMMDMKEGERVDQRNSAMSAVADLLGVPNLIARSRNMKFRDSKGNVLEGTFMDVANGTDLAHGTNDNALKVADKPFDGPGKEGLRQLCDLQVVDYICGNIDRHAGNVVFELDKDGHVIGVQGIDNDSSFSRFSPKKMDLNDLMTAPANMRIMSKSMAERIKNTDPAMLKFSLRGRGLSEEELDAAVDRLNNTKEAILESEKHYNSKNKKIDKKHLYILPDNQFRRLDISYLRRDSSKEATSTINEVATVMNKVQKYKKGLLEKKEATSLQLKDFDATERDLLWSNVRKKIGSTRQFVSNIALYNGNKTVASVDDLTNSSHGGSEQFANMVKNMKELNKYNEGAYRKDREDQILTTQQYMKTQHLWSELDSSADIYLAKKMREKGVKDLKDLVGKNEYERDRIEYAKRVKAYTSKHKIEALTDHQKEILKQHDEGDLVDFNKKMKEEALKIQKKEADKGPKGPVLS